MLDIRYIVNNAQEVAENARRRGYDIDIDRIVELDAERRKTISSIEDMRQQGKSLASRSVADEDDRDAIRDTARTLKERIAADEVGLRAVQAELDTLLALVPNMLDPRVPIGGEEDFTLVRTWGEIPSYDFEPKSHEVLAEAANLLDVAAGVRVAGSRFYVLKNEAVRLRYAMTALFLDMTAGQGWQLVSPPFLAREETLFTAGYTPFASKDNYKIEEAGLSLIGTSEQAILGFHMGEIVERLPLLYLGDSMCFRTEAGAAGRDTRGIIRVHQFSKLEQIVLCAPEDAEKWHLQCLENEERFLQLLGIPYRMILCPSSDIAK
jgi:seryl-tRNA synthetase